MEKEKEYIIPVSGMALGQHTYQFEIGDDFFAMFDYSEVKKGKVNLSVEAEREETMLTLNFNLSGVVTVPCDRCADDFGIAIESTDNVFVIKTGEEVADNDDEDIAYVPAEQGSFDVSKLIYEYIILAIPMHRVHPDGQCNPEVLEMLNKGADPQETESDIDPRWEALKQLKTDEEK